MKSYEIRQALGRATDELAELVDDEKGFAAKEVEITGLEGQLKRSLASEQRSAALGKPVNNDNLDPGRPGLDAEVALFEATQGRAAHAGRLDGPAIGGFSRYVHQARAAGHFQFNAGEHFRSFGEQLQAIQQFAVTRGQVQDNRLIRAPLGAGEVDPTGGGFLVQTDFSDAIWMRAYDMGELLSRVNKLPISANANGIKIPGINETSRATGSRWGGVESFWVDEGTSVNNTKPAFRIIAFDLKKLMSTMYITEELIQDSTALSSIAGIAFSEEVVFMTEDAIFEGTGAGQPLGYLNSPCKVTVPKETGQPAGTIVKENIDKMWSRGWARSRKNAVWLINQDIEPQLNALNQAVGTGGNLVYLPPGGLSAAPYASLYGRPVLATEYSSSLGTEGDISLADLSQYTLCDKGGVQTAMSMHVAFLTDQQVFRITYRVDGKPMWNSALTPFKGSATKSPFITLASR